MKKIEHYYIAFERHPSTLDFIKFVSLENILMNKDIK